MLPAGAYVTLEHEYILIVRKGSKREFKTEQEKLNRRESAIFWEERNTWYSDVWFDVKGTGQNLSDDLSRFRSAAFPFELAYRLINMYSVKSDVVLDPFLGTGTTIAAAMTSGRNGIGVEIDKSLSKTTYSIANQILDFSNKYLFERLMRHFIFVENRLKSSGSLKYKNGPHGCPVVTSQEQFISLNSLEELRNRKEDTYEVRYSENPEARYCFSDWCAGTRENSRDHEDLKKRRSNPQLDLLSKP